MTDEHEVRCGLKPMIGMRFRKYSINQRFGSLIYEVLFILHLKNHSLCSKSFTSYPENCTSYPKNYTSYPENCTSYPDNYASYPDNYASYLDNYASYLDNYASYLDNYASYLDNCASYRYKNSFAIYDILLKLQKKDTCSHVFKLIEDNDMNTTPVRKYQMTDAELSVFVFLLHGFLTRDLPYLEEFNITEEKLDDLLAMQKQFKELFSDNQYQALTLQVIETRNKLRKESLEIVGAIRARAQSAFGQFHNTYKAFNFNRISMAKDAELPARLSVIALTAINYLAELTEYGQTQEELDDLQVKANNFTELLQSVNAAASNRTDNARERITMGNQMYFIASTYAKIAQQKFSNSNPAKYLDYVIYPNRKKKKPKTDEQPAE